MSDTETGDIIEWYRYVNNDDIALYESQGWVVAADLGQVHGRYAVLMKYDG